MRRPRRSSTIRACFNRDRCVERVLCPPYMALFPVAALLQGTDLGLGAQDMQLVRLTMRRGVVQLALGLGIGLTLALVAVGPLQPILYRVEARDPGVMAMVLAALAVAGLSASFIPARRVTRIDPIVALTVE